MSLQHANDNSKKAMIAKKISESNLHSFQELEDLFDEFDASNGKALPKQKEEIEHGQKRTTLPIFGEDVPELQVEEEIEVTEEDLMKLDSEFLDEMDEEDLEHIYNKDYSLLSEEAKASIRNAIKEHSEFNKGELKTQSVETEENGHSEENSDEDLVEDPEGNLEDPEDNPEEDSEENLDEDDFSTILDEEQDPDEDLDEDEFLEEHSLLGTIEKNDKQTPRKENNSEKPKRTPKEDGFREIDEEKIKGFFKNLFKKKDKEGSEKKTKIKKQKTEKDKKGFFGKKSKNEEGEQPEKKGFLKKKINNDKKDSFNAKKIVIIVLSIVVVLALTFFFLTKGSSFKSVEELKKEGLMIQKDLITLTIPAPKDEENYTGSILIYLTLEEENNPDEIQCESDIVDVTVGEEISSPMKCNKDVKENKKYKIKTLESNYF